MTTTEFIVINGHILGECAYLADDDLTEECDCAERLENDDPWGGDDDDDY
jgi:hypothetical protein